MATAEKHKKRSSYSSHVKAPYAALNKHGYMKYTEKMYKKVEGAFSKLMSMIGHARRREKPGTGVQAEEE